MLAGVPRSLAQAGGALGGLRLVDLGVGLRNVDWLPARAMRGVDYQYPRRCGGDPPRSRRELGCLVGGVLAVSSAPGPYRPAYAGSAARNSGRTSAPYISIIAA
jgi:hypothetical protein